MSHRRAEHCLIDELKKTSIMETTMQKPRISYQEAPEGLYELMLNIEKYLKDCGIEHSLLELIKTRASQINRCGYCLDMHHKDALHDGETFQRLYSLPAWEEAPFYTPAEKVVLRLTDTLTEISQYTFSDIESAYDEMEEHYTKQEIANIVLAINQINSWNRISITFGAIPGSYPGKK